MIQDQRTVPQGVKNKIIIFTDLDGTLLDEKEYTWAPALPALEVCRRMEVPVVLASSKTRAEIWQFHQAMGLKDPFIFENGGGAFFPTGTRWPVPPEARNDPYGWLLDLGRPYPELVRALAEIRQELGWNLKGFSEMGPEEIAALTGLGLEGATLASQREYDEPFMVIEPKRPDQGLLEACARKRGLRITRGGRFYHLHGIHDKGLAMERLLGLISTKDPGPVSVALGDSPIDFPMLARADVAVLVRSHRGYPELEDMIPDLLITSKKGPEGWNRAVLEILERFKEED